MATLKEYIKSHSKMKQAKLVIYCSLGILGAQFLLHLNGLTEISEYLDWPFMITGGVGVFMAWKAKKAATIEFANIV